MSKKKRVKASIDDGFQPELVKTPVLRAFSRFRSLTSPKEYSSPMELHRLAVETRLQRKTRLSDSSKGTRRLPMS